jgi:hypothetical protein
LPVKPGGAFALLTIAERNKATSGRKYCEIAVLLSNDQAASERIQVERQEETFLRNFIMKHFATRRCGIGSAHMTMLSFCHSESSEESQTTISILSPKRSVGGSAGNVSAFPEAIRPAVHKAAKASSTSSSAQADFFRCASASLGFPPNTRSSRLRRSSRPSLFFFPYFKAFLPFI